jgi:predicted Zn-dependent protease
MPARSEARTGMSEQELEQEQEQEQLRMAEQVLDLARAEGGSGVEAEVVVDRHALALTRFANSFIHQNVAEDTARVRLRLHLGGRTATASTTVTTTAGLTELAARTVAAARLAPVDPGWPGLAPPSPATGQGGFEASTAGATGADRAAKVRAFVDAAGGLPTAGYVRTELWSGAFANSAGQTATGTTTQAAIDGIARVPGSDGVARLAAAGLSDLDGAVLGARAAAKAKAGTDPVELPPGRYEVVLERGAVADIMHALALWGFNGKAVTERRSFAVLGEAQFDSSITLVDDPMSDGDISLPFDGEGTPRRRLVLVDAGVTATVAHDRRTAAKAGAESTGHALPDAGPFGSFPLNLRIASETIGQASEVDGPVADSSVAALVANVKRGVLVTDFWYTRVLDPKTLAMTGLTRNGVWLIEGGEVVGPVKNFRFTQSYPNALRPGQVLGIGTHAEPQPDGWSTARWTAPALHLASWNFTGGASG